MKKMIFITLLTTSCASIDANRLNINKNIDFNKDYTVFEFKKILNIYSKLKPYPDINN